jgi:hypothetical protein
MDQVLTPPRTVTLAAIQTARAAFEQRMREAATSDDGLPLDDIAIACPMTRRQLDRVPDHWLYGIRVMLRADGTLVITKRATEQHQSACLELVLQLGSYAATNGMVARITRPLTLPDGSVMTPDVQIFLRQTTQNPVPVPLALFEVEVRHRCTLKIIETAAHHLHQLPSVERVVVLKYFDPRPPALETNELRVPAMLLVFRRASGANARLIEVAQMCSFGNEKIHDAVARTLATPSGYHVPYTVTEQQRAAADWLPDAFTLDNLLDELGNCWRSPTTRCFTWTCPRGSHPSQWISSASLSRP